MERVVSTSVDERAEDPQNERVILVDRSDRPLGEVSKLDAHRDGLLHRAFSIFIFNHRGEMLLQKRDAGKYHSGDLWSNSCCSHPRPGESVRDAAERRLMEEMGFSCELEHVFSTVYRAGVSREMIEHEYDHVFVGVFDGEPKPQKGEVSAWRWISLDALEQEVEVAPWRFSVWFRLLCPRITTIWRARANSND